MNEANTRAELIDPQLKAAGWETGGAVRVLREHFIAAGKISTSRARDKASRADYVLSYKNVKLAVIEAKSDELEVSEGVAQAKRDAEKLDLPFSFAANGKAIYQISHRDGKEGPVDRFPTPDELWEQSFPSVNEWLDKFNGVPFEDMNGTKQARYYQEIAVNRALEAIADNRRRVLLTLATGTGKTFIAFQIAWKLFKSRWNLQRDGKRRPRVLFLADRNILADQAYVGFSAFSDDARVRIRPSEISERGEVPKNGSVFFTIFQTFMSTSGERNERYFTEYESDFFDLVVIDECHRGGARDKSTWRGILEHFDKAVHLGMTATPRRDDNADTYDYFGKPVFTYSLKEGIEDGFLTPFKVKRIDSNIDDYIYAPDDEVIEGEVEEGRVYKEMDFNKRIEIEARERKRVQDMLATINPNEKTIVFCASQGHAAKVRNLINQESDNKSVDYCVRVTANDGAIGDNYLRQFRDNERTIPTILTTTYKLTTGVDALNVRNIVIVRPINSMIEFKQIIGRGTRLYDGKYYFTIIDFVNAYQRFNDPGWDGEDPEWDMDTAEDPEQGEDPITPLDDDGGGTGKNSDAGGERQPMLRIKLSDGKVRELKSMSSTRFYVNSRLITAKEFLEWLLDTVQLRRLLGSEEEFQETWVDPVTRHGLLEELSKAGCDRDDLDKLQEQINAENSDLYDVLKHAAYAEPVMSRQARAEIAEEKSVYLALNEPHREFVRYVLANYVKGGINELDIKRLSTVLTAKYGSIYEAQQILGDDKAIQGIFIGFQQHLYK